MSSSPLRFDDALPAMVAATAAVVGESAIHNGDVIFLRDVAGVLTAVIRNADLIVHRQELTSRLSMLKPYADEVPITTPEEMFDDVLAIREAGYVERITLPDGKYCEVRVVDRRMIGADWLRAPLPPAGATPIVVFWSLKGGVGRSTALCTAAATLARRGYNILALDLDLEAPGIGDMLLNAEDRPKFGALDFFVENNFNAIDSDFLRSMVSPSRITSGRGLVSVVPATGLSTEESPQNMLAKLARGYLDTSEEGERASFLDQTRNLVTALGTQNSYDAIFVDARAGLNESTAASLLGLGGLVLLFGVNTPQTFRGYRYVFAHLNRFTFATGGNWRERLQMVHAKASPSVKLREKWMDYSFDLFSEWIYDEANFDDIDAFNFDLSDTDSPHFGWPILHDANFLEFDPLSDPSLFDSELTSRTFGFFVEKLAAHIGLPLSDK